MDELSERRMEGQERRQRISALMARVDAGEAGALEALERRVRGDEVYLFHCGKPELAEAAWGWALARIEDVERAEAYAGRVDDGREAPARWMGLRVRVTHIAGAGLTRPVQTVGRLASVTARGLQVLTDDIEEEGVHGSSKAGDVLRRVKAERLVTWVSVLTVQPLPVREVFAVEANVREHEEAVVDEQDAGDPPEEV